MPWIEGRIVGRPLVGSTVAPVVRDVVQESVQRSPPWRVILHNDEITTMEFVVWLLVTLFHKSYDDANRLMLEVHYIGVSTVTVCPQERAELYVEQVRGLARPRGFPLAASAEPT